MGRKTDTALHPDFKKKTALNWTCIYMGSAVMIIYPMMSLYQDTRGFFISFIGAGVVGWFFVLTGCFVSAWGKQQREWQTDLTRLYRSRSGKSGTIRIQHGEYKRHVIHLLDGKSDKTFELLCTNFAFPKLRINEELPAVVKLSDDGKSMVAELKNLRLWCTTKKREPKSIAG